MTILPRTPAIYQIRHRVSGKVYVGSSVNLHSRWIKHQRELNRCTHHCAHLQSAWARDGADAFACSILEMVADASDLLAREQYWMDTLCVTDKRYGYNIAPRAGSKLGMKLSVKACANIKAGLNTPEARERLRAAAGTPEARAKNSERTKRQHGTPDARAKNSAAAKKRMSDPAFRARMADAVRASITPAVRVKMSESAKRRHSTPEAHAEKTAATKQQWSDPEARAKILAARSTPEGKARASAAAKGREAAKKRKRESS